MNRNIVLGVTGSIAAYKAAELVRLFVKNGDSVTVVMTPAVRGNTADMLLIFGRKAFGPSWTERMWPTPWPVP